ncbi:MAG: glycosyltransferase family 4 protein [Gemmatimonadetes bacterium]|nr:glycosyltransferase family 4 protein [Gemmatimonadota bacterium]
MSRPYRIAMVAACPFPYPRGTPVRILRMAEALVARGNEVHVVTYHHGDMNEPTPFPVHRIADVKTYRKLSPGPTYQKLLLIDPMLARKLRTVVREHDIDLIHAHHYEGLLVAAAARRATKHPIVYDAHTLLESELPFYKLGLPASWKRGIGRRIDGWLPRKAEHVIAVTDRIRSHLVRYAGLSPDHVSKVQNGVESAHFAAAMNGTRWRDDSAERRVVYAGNLSAYQGIELLLHAFAGACKQRRDLKLVLVTGSRFDAYQELARALGIRDRIEIVQGGFERLPEEFGRAHLAVNPRTECDGIPQKLLNYMAAGLPVLSFAGSAKNIDHGRNGWIVKDHDIPGFATAILHLLARPKLAAELGARARALVLEKSTWEQTAINTEAVYEKVLAARAGGTAGNRNAGGGR